MIGQRMTKFKVLKGFFLSVVVYTLFKTYLKLKKKLIEWKRQSELALKLPCVPRPREKERSLDAFGTLARKFPDGKFTTESMSKYYVKASMEIIAEYGKDEGILFNWIFNPQYTIKPIGTVVVIDGNIARQLLSTKMLPFFKKGRAYDTSSQLLGQGVLSTSGEVWHKQRTIIERGFTQTLIEKQFPMVVETANDLVAHFKTMQTGSNSGFVEVDMLEEMLKTTMDVLGRVAFSYEIGSLKCADTKDAPLYNAFDIILQTLHVRLYSMFKNLTRKILPSDENIAFNNSLAKLTTLIREIIRARRKEGINENPKDLLDILLQGTINAEGQKVEMSEATIIDNMKTILFAGHDTTAAALTWSFYLLAKHPQVGARILDEFKTTGNDMSVQTLENCSYLNAVVIEVLRLYPSAGFTRTAVQEFKLGKYNIPKNVDILIIPYLIHRNDKTMDRVNDFLPERWLNKDTESLGLQATLAKATLNKTYLPFSLGKRNCVGRKLALLEIRVIILKMLLAFDIKLPDMPHVDFQEEPYLGLTLYPKGVHICFKPK